MTHVWPVFGEAPVPSTVSSYWRPEGVVFIFDSFLSAAAAAGTAGAGFLSARVGGARDAAQGQEGEGHETAEPRTPLLLMLIEFFIPFSENLLRTSQSIAVARRRRTPRVARHRPSSPGRSASSRGSPWGRWRGCAACRRWRRPGPPRRRAREGRPRT